MVDISSLKRPGDDMTNSMLKQVTQIIRKTGVKFPPMSQYYTERENIFKDCIEHIQLELDIGNKHGEELKYIWVVRCIDVITLLERFYNSWKYQCFSAPFQIRIGF